MTEPGEVPSSPPLPRGAYNFNFDDFDEFSDPFKPKKAIPNDEIIVGKKVDQNSNNPSKEIPDLVPEKTSKIVNNVNEKESVEENNLSEKEQVSSSSNEKEEVSETPREKEKDVLDTDQERNSSVLVDMTEKTTSEPPTCLSDVNPEPQLDLNTTSELCSSSSPEKSAVDELSSPDTVNSVIDACDQIIEPSKSSDLTETAETNNNNIQPASKPSPKDSSEDKKQPKKKKVMKKPKSRLKPPEHFNKHMNNVDEIQIFEPPAPSTKSQEEDVECESTNQTSSELNGSNDVTDSALPDTVMEHNSHDISMELPSESSNQNAESLGENKKLNNNKVAELANEQINAVISESNMTDSLEKAKEMAANLDVVHEFGAGEEEMLDLDNEGFVPASDVFNDSADWGMLEKCGGSPKIEDGPRDSLYEKFDPLTPSRGANQSKVVKSEQNENTSQGQDDLMQMTTPPIKKSHTSHKHPAARALSQQVDTSPETTGVAKEVDQMYFGPGKGDKKKQEQDDVDDQPYYDAPDSPLPKEVKLGKVDKATSKMSGDNNTEVVQLVQDNHSGGEQVLKYSQTDWNKLKQELELEFQARLLNKEREWSKKLADRDKKISNLEEQARTLKQSNDDMRAVVTEFEKIISELQADKEKSKTASQETVQDLQRERDQAIEDLAGVEASFSDLHRRYEKTKSVVEGFKKNEEILKRCVSDCQTKLKKTEDKAQAIKLQAEEKLNIANIEMEKLRKATASDSARYEAALKKAELHVQSLERSLDCKVKENEELTSICDELIAKVGT